MPAVTVSDLDQVGLRRSTTTAICGAAGLLSGNDTPVSVGVIVAATLVRGRVVGPAQIPLSATFARGDGDRRVGDRGATRVTSDGLERHRVDE